MTIVHPSTLDLGVEKGAPDHHSTDTSFNSEAGSHNDRGNSTNNTRGTKTRWTRHAEHRMSRRATMIHTNIWEQDEFTQRNTQAQLVYIMLITQPTVAPTGLLALTTRKWARYTTGHIESVEAALHELAQHTFVWIDEDAEELVIRSWVTHNILGSPKMETAAANQFHAISSRRLRDLLSVEYEDVVHSSSGDRLFPEAASKNPSPFVEASSKKENPDLAFLGQPSQIDTLSPKSSTPRGVRSTVQGTRSNSDVSRARANADASRPTPDDTELVWATYQEYHPRACLTSDRRRLIERRLREWPVDMLTAAIRGNHADPWCREHGHHALDLIIRNADKIERYASVLTNPRPPASSGSAAGRMLARAHETAEREVRDAG